MLFQSFWSHLVLIFAIGIAPKATLANPVTTPSLNGLEQAISDQMTGLIQKSINENFRLLKIQPPAEITVKTTVSLTQDGPSPQLAEVHFDVVIATDQPPQIIKSIRQKLLRMLKNQGYRLDEAAPGTDLKPLAILSIEARPRSTTRQEELSPWIYAGFAFLVLALLTSLGALAYALLWPLLGWRKRRRHASQPNQHQPADESFLPDLDLPLFNLAHSAPEPGQVRPENEPIPQGLPQLPTVPVRSKSEIDLGSWSTLSSADQP